MRRRSPRSPPRCRQPLQGLRQVARPDPPSRAVAELDNVALVVTFDPHVCTSLGRTHDQIVGALQRRAVAPTVYIHSDCKPRFTGQPRMGLSSEHPNRGVPARNTACMSGPIAAARPDLYKARPI